MQSFPKVLQMRKPYICLIFDISASVYLDVAQSYCCEQHYNVMDFSEMAGFLLDQQLLS